MAYDQHAAYEPPRRHYYDPTPPSNPARNDYQEYNPYAQGGSEQHDYYDQGYNQSYSQQNGGYHDNAYGHDMHVQQPQYNDGYQRGNARPRQDYQPDYQDDGGRSYDPRYQPRAQRGPPTQPLPQPPRERARPPQNQYAGDPRGLPPNQNGYHEPQNRRDPYQQQNGMPPPMKPPPQNVPPAQKPSKPSMEEWKAKERARFQQDAISPDTLPLDNAFPVFPKKKDRAADRSGANSASSHRRSEEQGRPTTSRSERSGPPRDNSYNPQVQAPPTRPDMDRQYSAPEFSNGSNGMQEPNGYDQRQAQSGLTTPVRDHFPDQWPMVAGQTPPKSQARDRGPPQANGYDQYSGQTPHGPPQQQAYAANGGPDPHRLHKQRGPPTAIDTRQLPPRPVHTGQPMSPAHVPQRPSTSHANRSRPTHDLYSPVSPAQQYAGSTTTSLPNQVPNQYDNQQYDGRSGSLGDIYDGYGTSPPRHVQRALPTREEEIEAEMPDFDAAAPNQTSNLHKRNQTVDKHLAEPAHRAVQPPPVPRMGTAPPQLMQQSGSAPDLNFAQQQYGPRPEPARGPGPRGMPQRGMPDQYGRDPAAQRQYDIPFRNQPTPQDMPYSRNGSLPQPNAPFASEPQVRRSMDDGRGPPNRQGQGQQQRFYQDGSAPRGPFPPQQRPDFERAATTQGFDRAGTAPPQQGLPQRPGTAGAPLSKQRSAPDDANSGNPDSLPHHPVPVRAGHLQQGQQQQSSKPPPVRNYGSASVPPQTTAPHQRQPSLDQFAKPVTTAELDRLRQAVDAPPHSPKQTLLLVKKLVEASAVLANENGRADQRTAGKNRERYLNEAYKRLKKLVANGYPEAQFFMADCYGQGSLGLEVDTKEAFKLYQAAAKSGHPQAAYRTAVCCEMGAEDGGGTSRDFPKAVQWYRRAAALGDGPAMYKLGAVLLKGLLGQQKNIAEAVNWLKRGAEKADKDNPHALHELAMLHESSNTNPEIRNKIVADDGYARQLYIQAAQLGYKFSQFRLGQAYEYGALGLPIDNRSSISYYTKAAAQGEHQAELALSGWYLTGAEGILEHSDTEAYLWARKAASSEPPLAKAMFAMGYFTENGIGCPASMEEARKWYGRAASYKFPKAIERLEELRRNPNGKGSKAAPANGKLSRKDQKKDEENCVVM